MQRIVFVALGIAAALPLVGCQKPYFMTEIDYVYFNTVSGEYEPKEYDRRHIVLPGNPRSVRDPSDRIEWRLSLEETKRIALANNKQIAFLGYQPAEAGTNIELQLSAFDANFSIGGAWSKVDRQINGFQSLGVANPSQTTDLFGGQAGFGTNATDGSANPSGVTTATGAFPATAGLAQIPGAELLGISKRNAAGGLTSISYGLDYNKLNPNPTFNAINPAWNSTVSMAIQQPLLQGAGVEYNRAPILVARANHEQAIKDFQTSIHTLLRDVEVSYWQLVFTYQDLYSRDVGMQQALATWQQAKQKEDVGTFAIPQVAQAREQYEFFRVTRLQALNRVLAAERDLRRLMGLPPDDERKIRPADAPSTAEYDPDWHVAVLEAMDLRPELASQRFAIRAAEIELARQRNGLLPDLTFGAQYAITGLADEFDQSIDRVTDNDFSEWLLSIRLRRPIGERAAHAQLRRTQLALSRERYEMRNLEHDIIHSMHETYQNVIANFELIQAQRDRRAAATQNLLAQEDFYNAGKTTIDVLLQAQTAFTDALRDESQAVVAYNQSLIQWEFARGTILTNDNVVLAEEQISKTDPKTLEQRRMQWLKSIPIPIHRGDKLSVDAPVDTTGPLYPDAILNIPDSPTKELPAAEAPVMEPIEQSPDPLPPMPKTEPVPITPTPESSASRSGPIGSSSSVRRSTVSSVPGYLAPAGAVRRSPANDPAGRPGLADLPDP